MKKILAFAGSNSSISINHQLVKYVISKFENHQTKLIKLTDFPLPMYSEDEEKLNGFVQPLRDLHQEIKESDALVISVNEHTSNPSAFFKNVIDWLSRLDRNFLEGKNVLVLSTSGGKRGAKTALEIIKTTLPRFAPNSVQAFSFPSFFDNFSVEKQEITNPQLADELFVVASKIL